MAVAAWPRSPVTPPQHSIAPSHRMEPEWLRSSWHAMLPKSPVPTFTWDSNNLKYVALAGRSRKLTFCLKQIYLTLTLCFLKAWLPTLEAKTSWPLKASKTWTAAAWTWATFRLSLSMGAEIGSRFSLFAWQNIANEAQKLKPWSWSLIYLWFLWFSLPSCLHLSSRSSLKRFFCVFVDTLSLTAVPMSRFL